MVVLRSSSFGDTAYWGGYGRNYLHQPNVLILKKRDWRYIKELAYFSSLGLQITLSIFIGYGLGRYLDGKWDTEPKLTILFFILGVIAAARNVGLAIKKLRKF